MSREKTKQIEIPVRIPTLDGKGIAETIMVAVSCTIDPDTGEELLNGTELARLDQIKARYMGLMLPDEIRQMRIKEGLTQKEMSELLQIGEKTFTRWESGRERPSRSMNLLLRSLADGKVNAAYLRTLRGQRCDWWAVGMKNPPFTVKRQGTSQADDSRTGCGEEALNAA